MLLNSLRLSILLIACLLSQSIHAATGAAEFLQPPSISSIALSPDGSRLATASSSGPNQSITLTDSSSLKSSELLKISAITDNDASLNSIEWIDNNTIALQFSESREGIKNLIDTKIIRQLLLLQLKPGLQGYERLVSVRTPGWLVDALPDEPGLFLYARSGLSSSIYKLDTNLLHPYGKKLGKLARVDGGQFTKNNRLATLKGYVTRWFLDTNGTIIAALHIKRYGELALSTLSEGNADVELQSWKSLESDESIADVTLPIAYADETNTFYGLNIQNDDTYSLYRINYSTDARDLLFQTNAEELIDVIKDPSGSSIIGVTVLRNAQVKHQYFDKSAEQRIEDGIGPQSWQLELTLRDEATSGVSLTYKEAHNVPGHYVITKNNQHRTIAQIYHHLPRKLQTSQVSTLLPVNGMEIPYLLTLPEGANANSPAPLIVMPHGGPIGVYDSGYFDLPTQFFAANGFAVLRVNYRGSGGHGTDFEAAGKLQWGAQIPQDIKISTEHVVNRADIDESRVCLFGASYGGYASTLLVLNHPQLYRCAVSLSGVSDINLHLSRTGFSDSTANWFSTYVGDPHEEYDRLRAESTVYQIDRLARPLLILHGDDDDIVDVEHSWRLIRRLERLSLPFEYHIYPGASHHFEDREDAVDLHERSLDFIQRSLSITSR